MGPEIVVVLMFIAVVLIIIHKVYTRWKTKRYIAKVNQEVVDAVRTSIVRFLNKELYENKRIDPMRLHTKCKDIQDMYVGLRIWNDIVHGLVMIDIRHEGFEASIECYQEPPSWYDGIENKYQVD